jgi:integrase
MASLRSRHQRACPRWQWTRFADKARCTCEPTHYIADRSGGSLSWVKVGKNRSDARRALAVHEGKAASGLNPLVRSIRFEVWADEWLSSFTGKESTRRGYAVTMEYAKRAFGSKKVRDLREADVRRFLDVVREANAKEATKDTPAEKASEATLARHLRQLGVCLNAAVSADYAAENPVRKLHKTHRPRPQRSSPTYFTDDELARLWPELAGVELALCKTAVSTGLRFGELVALRWSDVNLLTKELRVARAWTEGVGETGPKSGKARVVDLTPGAVAVLEGWYKESNPAGDAYVFDRYLGKYRPDFGRIAPGYMLQRVLYPALERAGISRAGEHGRNRTFHSFRHTFARIALENAAPIDWVKRQLGHSSITLTVDTYGEWSREAHKREAERLDGVFPV